MNTEKFKTIHNLEEEKAKSIEKMQHLEEQVKESKSQLKEEREQKTALEGKIEEVSYEVKMLRERDGAREKLLNTLEEKARKYESQINQDSSMHM